jgi:tetratricopeptide (TPR) repeat protein
VPNRLSDLGRREDALAAIQEAAQTYRELAAARPDAFRPDLAMALNNLSLRLSDLGRREDALAAIEEAAQTYRELAAAWPDAYLHELEQSLQVAAWLEQDEDHSDAAPRKPKRDNGPLSLLRSQGCRRNGPGPVAGHAELCNTFYDDHRRRGARPGPRQ